MGTNQKSRAEFYKENPQAKAWSVLEDAVKGTPLAGVKLKADCFKGKTAIIIGSGVGGLTTAYELLSKKTGMTVTILEAKNRTGGRCLTLRTGDTLNQDDNRDLNSTKTKTSQVVRFEHAKGDQEPYLNAGPGRIPSGHKRLIQYLKKFGVALEIYVMDSSSNLVQSSQGFDGEPIVSRRLEHNTRGWIANMVWQNAKTLIKETRPDSSNKVQQDLANKLQDLMVSFGDLGQDGEYQVAASAAGRDANDTTSDRAGFEILPGVESGITAKALQLDELLDSEFWKCNFYQSQNFLWQPTMFQPVGGMDRVQHAFVQQVSALGGTIQLNSPVKKIDWNETTEQFEIHVSQIGSDECEVFYADFCFSNVALPFLENMLSDSLQKTTGKGLDKEFKESLEAVYTSQKNPEEINSNFPNRFLACTTKVGWQADRSLWQGSTMRSFEEGSEGTEKSEFIEFKESDGYKDFIKAIEYQNYSQDEEYDEFTEYKKYINFKDGKTNDASQEKNTKEGVKSSEIGVVPIFGGISRTDDIINQIWYPSNDYQDKNGILTGCYNYSKDAYDMGVMDIKVRLETARKGAKLFGEDFAAGLGKGVAIAWQNVPYIKGGWAQWHLVGDITKSVDVFNSLTQGSCINGGTQRRFFVVGDQLSSIPGWQEGAIASALNAVWLATDDDYRVARLSALPDTRIMVEGI